MSGNWNDSGELGFEVDLNLTNSTDPAFPPSPFPSPPDLNNLNLVFTCFVIVVGVIGCVANGLVLRVLLSLKLRAQTSYILVTNQVLMDLYSCIAVIICYGSKVVEMKFWGRWGFFVCAMIYSDAIAFNGLTGSIAGVAIITIERYFKVVHPIAHRKNFRNWMIYAAIPITWLNGILTNITTLASSEIVDGVCNAFCVWPNALTATAYSVFILVWEYVIPLVIFVYCYWHILAVIRGQAKVFQGGTHGSAAAPAGPNSDALAQQVNNNRVQMNIIVTMIAISVAFVVCWTPNQVYNTLFMLNLQVDESLFGPTVFMIFLNTILNPFIYAAKLDPVRKGLQKMIGRNLDQSKTSKVTEGTLTS